MSEESRCHHSALSPCDGCAVWGMAGELISGSQLCSYMGGAHFKAEAIWGMCWRLELLQAPYLEERHRALSVLAAEDWLSAPGAFSRVHLDPGQFYALFLQSHVKLSCLDSFPRDTRYCCGGRLWLPLGYRQLWIPLWPRGLSLLFKVQKEETWSK